MFGGYQACVADPFPAIACGRIFPEYSSWTRAMSVDFRRGGTTDLEFRFDFDRDQENQIRKELEERGRSTPTFECGFYDTNDNLVTKITNVVAIRTKGYIKASSPPADNAFRSKSIASLESAVRERVLSRMRLNAPEDLDEERLAKALFRRDLVTETGVSREMFHDLMDLLYEDSQPGLLTETQKDQLFVLLENGSGTIDLETFRKWWREGI